MRFAHAQAAGRSAQHGHGRAPEPGAVPHRRRRRTLLRRLVSPVTVGIESTGYSLWFHALLRWVLGQAAPLATRGDAALKRIYFAVLRRRGRPKAKVALARRTREKRYATSSTASPAALIAVSNLQICIPV